MKKMTPMKEILTKKTPAKGKAQANVVMPMSGPKCVRIQEAENGYTVSMYTENGEKSMIAKDFDEVMKCAKEMMGEK